MEQPTESANTTAQIELLPDEVQRTTDNLPAVKPKL
jgi:hypothetical protein